MNSLSFIVLFHVLTGIHVIGKGQNRLDGECIPDLRVETLFTCLYKKYHEEKGCIETVKMVIQREKLHIQRAQRQKVIGKTQDEVPIRKTNSHNCNDNTDSDIDNQNKERSRNKIGHGIGNKKNGDRENKKKRIFKVGAIVGISVGITGTIILFLIVLVIIFVCRRRSKKKKRKHLNRQQAINQRLQINKYESGSFSTSKGGCNIPFVVDEAQGEYFVPSFTKYDKDLSNRKLPEIKRCSGAEGDDNVYYEIDEDKINSSTDIDGVYQNKIKEFTDKGSYHSDKTRFEIQLGSMNKKREQLTKQQSIDQRSEIASLESSTFSTNNRENTILFANESLNTDEEQGEYFVLDPSITKNDKDLGRLDLTEIKRFSVAQGDERLYNEIDEDEIQPTTDMKDVRQKKIEVKVKCSYHDQRNIRVNNKQDHILLTKERRLIFKIVSSGDKVIMSVNESLNTDEEQGEYFVLDPSVTKYDRDISNLVLPEVKRFSIAQGDEKVYNEIDEGKYESSTDIQVDHQKQIEDVRDIAIYRTDHTNHGTQLEFDNTTYHVASEIDNKSF
ncbi:Hypothetical predicted protein [Mytilus galloprovincialis]|uniref:Uncharacterized protein n=1 Tax=Mytilus galloprovincialis TaxID=29158 RepID=A0A8B6H0P6_MYTGA|nr:Hypothetical predicted protein [Mytilus galloprovincialis]